jgi:hypothetical protein
MVATTSINAGSGVPEGMTYVSLIGGGFFSMALAPTEAWSRGATMATTSSSSPRFRPASPTSPSRAASSSRRALRSDGQIVCAGWNADGQCNVAPLPRGVTYVGVGAGARARNRDSLGRNARRLGQQ